MKKVISITMMVFVTMVAIVAIVGGTANVREENRVNQIAEFYVEYEHGEDATYELQSFTDDKIKVRVNDGETTYGCTFDRPFYEGLMKRHLDG